MKKIAIYGKGGIGKSTIVSNLSASLSDKGYKVMQIGCDPKADSTSTLMKGNYIPTILEVIQEKSSDIDLKDIVFEGYNGVLCAEAGGPMPGIGCAGRGIITAFEKLEELNAYEIFNPDIVLYDVLGDVVCGGFSMPMRRGYADGVYIVTSGEKMSLYAASNIAKAIGGFGDRGYAKLRGLVFNAKGFDNEKLQVEKAAADIGVPILKDIHRDRLIQEAEEKGCTVVEAFPESSWSKAIGELAERIMQCDE